MSPAVSVSGSSCGRCWCSLARARTPRLRRLRVAEPVAGLPILADDRIARSIPRRWFRSKDSTACVTVGDDPAVASVASRFDAGSPRWSGPAEPARVVILAGLADRVHDVAHERRILERLGTEVVGVAVAAESNRQRRLSKQRSSSD